MSEILHSSLLKGSLSIKVSDTDIRRSASGITGTSAIETDYILCISPSNTEKKLSTSSINVDELKTYHCSKRYLDLRHLAKSMQEHAVEVIKFYSKKGGNEHDHYLGKGALVKNVKEFAHFITNTERSKSSVATDLDTLFKKGKKSLSTGDINNTHRLTSSVLTEGAPIYIRKVLEGVDDFFECIFTEKRQFGGKKTNIDYVKKVAARRQKIIDDAFQKFLDALAHADLDQMIKSQLVPKSMMELIKSMEKFLLTDVLKDTNTEQVQNSRSSGSLSSDDYVDVNNSPPSTPPQDEAPAEGRPAMVKAMSIRHRMSNVDREEEEKECALVDELVLAESVDEKDHEIKTTPPSSPNEHANEGRKKNVVHAPPPMGGLLSDDPLEFGILLLVGTVFFKLLQGRTTELQMDVLALFGLACGLIGYQLAASNDTTELVVDYSPTRKRVHVAEPTSDLESRSRPSFTRSSRGSRILMQKSALIMKSMRFSSISDDDDDKPKEAVPLKTFEMFPEGAKIGSHLNCWSSPPSSNFHVRGPNYIKDRKKVPSTDYIFPTRGVDLFLTDNPPVNIGRYDGILNGKLREKPTFIINYRLPWGTFISYHEIPSKFLPFLRKRHGHGSSDVPLPSTEGMSPGEQAMCNFLLSDSEEKNEVLKIVPVIVEGPWVVKKVVGGKPAIIGTKLPISYVYQPPEKGLCEYLEADLDIVSSAAARNILAVVRSYTQVLTIDLGFVVQGNTNQYLPEQMMLGLRLHGLDPLTAELLPETHHDVPHLTDDGNETD